MSDVIELDPGPVMLDVAGLALTGEDRDRLRHPLVGGVILFGRNYASPEQVAALTNEIRLLRRPQLLIGVDQEGGRVQRFRDAGFTTVPAMARIGARWETDPAGALRSARAVGVLIGAELAASGLDLSFAPVLDLAHGPSAVIGDRAFHRDPEVVAELAAALIEGLREQGMAAVGKHFPGHGFVGADSHVEGAVDVRPLADIEAADLVPYQRLIPGGLAAVMPSHVIYPAVDPRPAGFSEVWLRRILRGMLGFSGLIFSDDLSMEGAGIVGGVIERATAALQAGCDMILVCNRPHAADSLLAELRWEPTPGWAQRLEMLRCHAPARHIAQLHKDPRWRAARQDLAELSG